MMQLIHDVVPASSLAFYTAFESAEDFAAGIAAPARGCDRCTDAWPDRFRSRTNGFDFDSGFGFVDAAAALRLTAGF